LIFAISVGSTEVGAGVDSTEIGSIAGSAESGAGIGAEFGAGVGAIAARVGGAEIHVADAQRSRSTACCAVASETSAMKNIKMLAVAAHCPHRQNLWSVANRICRTFVGKGICSDYTRKKNAAYKIFRHYIKSSVGRILASWKINQAGTTTVVRALTMLMLGTVRGKSGHMDCACIRRTTIFNHSAHQFRHSIAKMDFRANSAISSRDRSSMPSAKTGLTD
jgi:hypothetical protein